MSTAKKISRNVFWLLIAEIVGKGFGFIITVLISRYLKEAGFGIYSFVFSFVVFFAIIADFGLNNFTIRELSRNKPLTSKLIGNIIPFKILITSILFVVMTLTTFLIDKPLEVKLLIIIAGCSLFIGSFTSLFLSVFRAFERMYFNIFVVLSEKITMLLCVLLIIFWDKGLVAIVGATCLSFLASLSVAYYILRKYFTKFQLQFDRAFLSKILHASMFFVITDIFIIIYFKIDIVMLSMMRGDVETGLYSAAYNLIFACMFIPAVMALAMYPTLSRFFKISIKKIADSTSKLLKYFLIASAPFVLAFFIMADFIINLVYGKDFMNSVTAFRYLSIVLVFVFLNFCLGTIVNSINKQKIGTYFSAVGALLNIVVNLLLIPIYGVLGAVVATIATEGILSLLYLFYVNKQFKIFNAKTLFKSARLALIVIITGLTVYLCRDFNQILVFILSMIVFSTLLFAFRIFNSQDRRYVNEILKNKF